MSGTQAAAKRSSRAAGRGVAVAILAIVTALAAVSCEDVAVITPEASGAAQTQQAPASQAAVAHWPTCGQIRQALTHKGYTFQHTGHYWQLIKDAALIVTIDDNDAALPGVSLNVYNATYDKYKGDIDNVFSVIAPEAVAWEHAQLNQTKTAGTLATSTIAAGGSITMAWEKASLALAFRFTGR
jgi:hypothetical protein